MVAVPRMPRFSFVKGPPECRQGDSSEGSLSCQCGRSFPIINGVPRFVPDEVRDELPKCYPECADSNSNGVGVVYFDNAAMDSTKNT